MNASLNCPACLNPQQLAPETWSSETWDARQCRQCGHVQISYREIRQDTGDLHDEYDQGAYTKSLLATRRRQAQLILLRLGLPQGESSNISTSPRLAIDYGAGLGVMTAALLQSKAYAKVIALDTSEKSLKLTQNLGAIALLAPSKFPQSLAEVIQTQGDFKIEGFDRIDLFALDLIEHFETEDWARDLRIMMKGLGSGQIILKFPNAHGFFHGFAMAAARLGWSMPFHRLALADSSFPHRHMFTPQSIQHIADRLGANLSFETTDLDFEPESFFDRLWSARSSKSLQEPSSESNSLLGSLRQIANQAMRFLTPLISALLQGDSIIVGLRWGASGDTPDSKR